MSEDRKDMRKLRHLTASQADGIFREATRKAALTAKAMKATDADTMEEELFNVELAEHLCDRAYADWQAAVHHLRMCQQFAERRKRGQS